MRKHTVTVAELFQRRGTPSPHFNCATCPINVGCYWECLRADDLREIAELKAEIEHLRASHKRETNT